jgi:2Fe-2S ferredoxin
MVRATFITHDGRERTVELTPGLSLMENAIKNGVEGIDAICGGNCYCGTCRVYVTPEWRAKVGAQKDYEAQLLDSINEKDPTVRLSCQITVTEELDGLIVRLPISQT